jgi:hypothetical protein
MFPFLGGFALANEAPADHSLGREADGGHPAGAAENGADPDAGGVLGITRELGLRESYGKYVDFYCLIIRMFIGLLELCANYFSSRGVPSSKLR